MAQEQDYNVNYTIKVDATEGTSQVIAFGEAVGKLVQAKLSLQPAVENISSMMQGIDKIFRTKNGKKRSYDYLLNINTNSTEIKLKRVKTLLEEIGELSKGINVVVKAGKPLVNKPHKLEMNVGQPLDSKTIKANAKSLLDKKAAEARKAEIDSGAISSVKAMTDMQKKVTKIVGKINAALLSLQKKNEINVQTDVAKERLLEILTLLNRIKGSTNMTLGLQMNSPGSGKGSSGIVIPFAPENRISDKVQRRLQEKLYISQQKHRQKLEHANAEFESKMRQNSRLSKEKEAEFSRRDAAKAAEWIRRQEYLAKQKSARIAASEAERQRRQNAMEERKAVQESERQQRQTAMQSVRSIQQQQTAAGTLDRSKRRAAINRIQYSKAPSLRTLPFASMVNAYMGYSLMRSELTKAIEYSNIMESARSILRVADTDLSTFESRFDQMARHIRRIGVETKFTAVEVAGAVKFLSMAGMDIETINKSMRPITNLALIGDNDVSYIADLTTNIMAGYDINNDSMGSVADILASTASRSNVNIVEMAESYKMAAGYLRTAGVEFSESSAAIGLLGNMGLKGTLAGTSLRAMSTRFAKPTKSGQDVLDRLGIKFTQMRNVYGKQVERLRPLADIFQDLHDKGATLSDMITVFGKIGGNPAMMFVQNYDKLRELAEQNRASNGISTELAQIKQQTTKGLWAQVTSQLTESFMDGYETLEPVIRNTLRSFLEKFKAPEFARGLISIGQALLDIVKVIGNIGTWFARNYYWIEPLIFTGVISTRLFKLAGMLTNVGVALGFIGKQAVATSSLELIQGLVGMKGHNKRTIVSALSSAGTTGKGAMRQALLTYGGAVGTQNVLKSLFATQVATGSGLTGAAASLSAISIGAVAATAGISALVGALGWVAYKTWKIKEAKDAMQEELGRNEKYRYPSIDALYDSLRKTYQQAIDTKGAVDDVTKDKTIEETSGQSTGVFTNNWWTSFLTMFGASQAHGPIKGNNLYTPSDAYQDDVRSALKTIARMDSQSRVNTAYAKLGKLSTAVEIDAFIKTIEDTYGQKESSLNKSLWTTDKNGKKRYVQGLGGMNQATAAKTFDYADYQNNVTVPEITRLANFYQETLFNQASAQKFMQNGNFDFDFLRKKGFSLNKEGLWTQNALPAKPTDKQRSDHLANRQLVKNALTVFLGSARAALGDSAEMAVNIMEKAGFSSDLYSNEPENNDNEPFNSPRITNLDDGGSGGNYSGTGKLSSTAPKQVVVNISNLMSIGTISLMKSKEGQMVEIQNIKEQLAKALIDVVHDFDASWNG